MWRSLAVLVCGFAALAPAVAARADNGPVIVIPTRPGVPVIINGVDASYAIVEGDWGLSRPGHGSITIIGGAPVYDPGYRRAYPRYGYPPPRGRHEIEFGPDRPLPESAESYSRYWSTHPEPPMNYGVRRVRPAGDSMLPPTITDPETFNQPMVVVPRGGRHRHRHP
jgi:hypothetical protein